MLARPPVHAGGRFLLRGERPRATMVPMTQTKQHRVVRISVCLPVTVEIRVSRAKPGPEDDPDGDWDIDDAELVTRTVDESDVTEHMCEEDWVAFHAAIAAARDRAY